mgnify:CR=1 FL=1
MTEFKHNEQQRRARRQSKLAGPRSDFASNLALLLLCRSSHESDRSSEPAHEPLVEPLGFDILAERYVSDVPEVREQAHRQVVSLASLSAPRA